MSDDDGIPIPRQNEDDDDVVLRAIKTIVRETNTPHAAKAAIQLLQEKLRPTLMGDGDDNGQDADAEDGDERDDTPRGSQGDDGDDEEADDSDIQEMLKEGTFRVSSTKKTENEKWRELLVYPFDGRY